MATSTVNSLLHSILPPKLWGAFFLQVWVLKAWVLTACVLSAAAEANTAAELDVLRVDVPLDQASFRNGELSISSLITNNTYIDVEEFNLRAIELEASSTYDGEVRLKVGRYVTPPVPLPGPSNEGLLRIEAPHKSNKSWRLLIEDRINITSLTAVLEPRDDNSADYQSRYESRGYTLGRDDNYRPYSSSRHDTWPYSWLNNNNDNRRSAHWFWLNDSRSRFQYNPGYGHTHRHSPRCYDRYGRHLSFNSSFGTSRSLQRSRDLDRYRNPRRSRITRPIGASPRLGDRIDTNREQNRTTAPVVPAPAAPVPQDAQRNQAAQAQLQLRLQQAQARTQSSERNRQEARQRQRQQQQRQPSRTSTEQRRSQALGRRAQQSDRSRPSTSQRSTSQRSNQTQRE